MRRIAFSALALTLALAASVHAAVSTSFKFVTVGDAGNGSDPQNTSTVPNIGAVANAYRIGAYEVTNAQYTAFLNSVAASDPHGLYHVNMTNFERGGINRFGADGAYTYSAKPGHENCPVNYVTWFDAARFTNWVNNGQGAGGTEYGAYDLSLANTPEYITRQPGAKIFLPNENEWYKAAYYDPTPGAGGGDNYWLYPTQSDSAPHSDNPASLNTPDNTNVANIFRSDAFGSG